MSKSTKSPLIAAAGAEAALSPEELVQQLRAIRERIPLPDPSPAPAALRRRLAHVDANFVQASINAAGASDVVQNALGRTDEELRQETDAAARWTAVADELRTLLKNVLTANTVRRQRIGLAALQTYKICEQLARDDAHASQLSEHIVEMKRLNRFGRRRKPAEPAQPTLTQQ
jgi:hypothetical protein